MSQQPSRLPFALVIVLTMVFSVRVLADDTKSTTKNAKGWSTIQLQRAREFSETLDTAAVVILHHGNVVDQWGDVALPLKCHSTRKSFLSALYGPHVAAGTIDLDSTLEQLGIDDNEPSLTDAERQATIRDLLKARSGIYHPALYETASMAAKRPKRGSHSPDTFWYYNNWDFNASCTIFENLTGRSIFEEFESRLAIPLGMQDFCRPRDTRYVTGDDSVHPAYPFRLSARDMAKFGQLMLQCGTWKEQQLIPEAWVRESTKSYSDAGKSGGYGYMWWVAADGKHFPAVTLPDGSFSARGHRGQYLVVIPKWDIVVCHRVNSYKKGTAVARSDFGELLKLILKAKPDDLAGWPSRNGLLLPTSGTPNHQQTPEIQSVVDVAKQPESDFDATDFIANAQSACFPEFSRSEMWVTTRPADWVPQAQDVSDSSEESPSMVVDHRGCPILSLRDPAGRVPAQRYEAVVTRRTPK